MKHRFFVESAQIAGDTVTFSRTQTHQIKSVLRLRAGDTVRVFDGLSRRDQVVELESMASGRVVGECPQAAEPKTRVVVYPALLQRDKFEQVLQKVTEVGAAAVVPVLTARSLIREPPDDNRYARWRAIVREAAEQSGRGILPELCAALPLEPALERAAGEGIVIVAYEAERNHTLKDVPVTRGGSLALFVGPEGGYEAAEVACAAHHGAHVVTLGPRILRTETAAPLMAALVLNELGDLSSQQDDQRL